MTWFAHVGKCLHRLIWLGGMVGIVWLMPVRFVPIPHEANERIVGFCGHELISATGLGVEDDISSIAQFVGGNDGITSAGPFLVRNIDTGQKRKIDYPGGTYLHWSQVIVAKHWLLFEEDSDSEQKICIVDLETGRRVKSLACVLTTSGPAPRYWRVTRDGNTLLYATGHEHDRTLCGIDIRTERLLWERKHAWALVVSPDDRLVAFCHDRSICIVECRSGREVCRFPARETGGYTLLDRSMPRAFSSDGSMLVDDFGTVSDADHGRTLYAGSGQNAQGLFVDSARQKLVYIRNAFQPASTLVLADCATSKVIYSSLLDQSAGPWLHPCVPGNRLIWLDDMFPDTNIHWPQPWLQRVWQHLPWLSNLMQLAAYVDHHCLLVDPLTGRSVFRTRDYLRAITDDCRYVVTEEQPAILMQLSDDFAQEPRRWKLYELPAQRSLPLSILACLVWTVALADVRLAMGRRGSR